MQPAADLGGGSRGTVEALVVSDAEVAFIEELIGAHPGASRRALSKKLCEAWDWVQPNGELRDMVCRSLMLELDRAELIELPPVRCRPLNNVVERRKPAALAVDCRPLRTTLSALQPLAIRQVRGTPEESLFHALLDEPAIRSGDYNIHWLERWLEAQTAG
mgnify:CR=1 FL=1